MTIHINLSYGISLLLSLYAGLTILLKLIAPVLISVALKMRCHFGMFGEHCMRSIQQLSIWAKELNLFKSETQREMNDIKRQRLITKIYLICLLSKFYVNFS